MPETDDREIEQVIYGGQSFDDGRKVEKAQTKTKKGKESSGNMGQDFDALVYQTIKIVSFSQKMGVVTTRHQGIYPGGLKSELLARDYPSAR